MIADIIDDTIDVRKLRDRIPNNTMLTVTIPDLVESLKYLEKISLPTRLIYGENEDTTMVKLKGVVFNIYGDVNRPRIVDAWVDKCPFS
jgi:hypothetical protein